MASILQAVQGAKVELAQKPSAYEKARLCTSYAKIIGQELIGTLLLAPYGYRTWNLHRTLPDPSKHEDIDNTRSRVFLLRNERYGEADRNVLDVYLPREALQTETGTSRKNKYPMAIFCHGGIWATGSKWQFAPLAACLAQRGIVTCVIEYSLYPKALVPQMVGEVTSAIEWLTDKCPQYGAAPSKVSLVGHSAGAQLCLMAVLSLIAKRRDAPAGSQVSPAKCIGMAGAYDIGMHYKYEEGRGVAFLSTMARAMGGPQNFASQSPAVVLNSIASSADQPRSRKARTNQEQMKSAGENASDSSLIGSSLSANVEPLNEDAADLKAGEERASSVTSLCLEDLSKLPDMFLMSSKPDVTVPWLQSSEMHEALQRCHAPTHHIVYDDLGHGDFVIDWQFNPAKKAQLPKFADDLVKIIMEEEGGFGNS